MGTFADWLYGRTKKKEEVHTTTTTRDWDKEYTAEEVHAELTSKFLLFMEDIKRTTEYKTVPDSVRQEYETLEKLGFTNSKNAELTGRIVRYVNDSNKKHEENIEALHFMKKAWETFGKDVMVVRYDHFFELLEKYNLVCGSFDRYTGTIPPENLAEIERVKGLLYDDVDYNFHILYRYIYAIEPGAIDLSLSSRFNLFPEEIGMIDYAARWYNARLSKTRPTDGCSTGLCSYPTGTGFYDRVLFTSYIIGVILRGLDEMFIAAPAQEMLPYKIQVWDKRVVIPNSGTFNRFEKARVRTYDPFICSLTKYGVMIFTKWGDEAQDGIIKQYEALSKYVNG